ncbi:Uncharacterized protein Fot_01025 [Forsythia ovata]|uniref:Uncharacterized protein n=1 Tax=Forsythia ovata TaxID=205694 RepID=A0ABD1X2T5_9LAMI
MSNSFETTFLTAWDEFVINECKTVTTMVGAAPIILARNLRVSSFNEDHTGCVSANMIGETAETFLQCSGQKLMQIAALKNQAILNDIRASTTEEHMLYVKVINNNKRTVALKYDVVFMLEPILDINKALNIGENPVGGFTVEEKTAPRTCINKQPIKAYAQPMLSPTKPVYGRTNTTHTCFQTNTVIASRNITDLRLVENIADQKEFREGMNGVTISIKRSKLVTFTGGVCPDNAVDESSMVVEQLDNHDVGCRVARQSSWLSSNSSNSTTMMLVVELLDNHHGCRASRATRQP